jgi:hypothetical protein
MTWVSNRILHLLLLLFTGTLGEKNIARTSFGTRVSDCHSKKQQAGGAEAMVAADASNPSTQRAGECSLPHRVGGPCHCSRMSQRFNFMSEVRQPITICPLKKQVVVFLESCDIVSGSWDIGNHFHGAISKSTKA